MNPINVLLLQQDLSDRYATFSLQSGSPVSLDRRMLSVRRQFYAIEEAVKEFISLSTPQSLVGYQEETELTNPYESENIDVYEWPNNAATSRIDCGLINIIVDDEEFIHFPVSDPRVVQVELNSLIMQARSPLLYGSFRNYVIDLNTKRIYTPQNRIIKIRYIKAHSPFSYELAVPQGHVATHPDYPNVPETIPIDNTHLEEISRRALAQLLGQVIPANEVQEDRQETE